jgi:hypothetical protein
MEMWQEILQYVILGGIIYLIRYFLENFSKIKKDESEMEKWNQIIKTVNEIVNAIEEVHRLKRLTPEEKLNYAIEEVMKVSNKIGLQVDEKTIKLLITSAVKKMRDEGKEYKKEANV